MNSSSQAIEHLYSLTGSDFDRRIAVIETNLKARLLEDFVRAPEGVGGSIEGLLGDLSGALILVQKLACREAQITDEQKEEFERRIDNCLADTIVVIRQSSTDFGDRTTAEFQLETAKKLGIPVE